MRNVSLQSSPHPIQRAIFKTTQINFLSSSTCNCGLACATFERKRARLSHCCITERESSRTQTLHNCIYHPELTNTHSKAGQILHASVYMYLKALDDLKDTPERRALGQSLARESLGRPHREAASASLSQVRNERTHTPTYTRACARGRVNNTTH
jgi:hypothetical protein